MGDDASAGFEDLAEFVRATGEHMRTLGLTSVDVELHGVRVKIRSSAGAAFDQGDVHVRTSEAGPEAISPQRQEDAADNAHLILAPMIGTYYSAASPTEPPYVEIGDRVEVGQTIGIIEAMKIMNEITADRAGVVEEILARNAEAVEYGQPLIRISIVE
jgi:acetyl-CoA carboxylase biotin carboxyl carrier protein